MDLLFGTFWHGYRFADVSKTIENIIA